MTKYLALPLLATALLVGCSDSSPNADPAPAATSANEEPQVDLELPGVDIHSDGDGTTVTAPGVQVEADRQEVQVVAPGVEVDVDGGQ